MAGTGKSEEKRSVSNDFTTTCWSVVVSAGRELSRSRGAALQTLCERYWPPLYAYVRRRVSNVEEAQDLTQSFFATLLEKNYLGSATPERGRFRAFLLTAFKHFLSKEWEKARALKRGGGTASISLDFADAESTLAIEPATDLTPEQLYDRRWAITLLQSVMDRLQREFVASGKAEQFDLLQPFVIGDHSGVTYAEVATSLGISPAAAKMAASRMRQRYRQLLRNEIAETVTSAEEVEDEIRCLFAVFE